MKSLEQTPRCYDDAVASQYVHATASVRMSVTQLTLIQKLFGVESLQHLKWLPIDEAPYQRP